LLGQHPPLVDFVAHIVPARRVPVIIARSQREFLKLPHDFGDI
jgi:hypothetical protein